MEHLCPVQIIKISGKSYLGYRHPNLATLFPFNNNFRKTAIEQLFNQYCAINNYLFLIRGNFWADFHCQSETP